jgi:hypothetical protein
MELKLMETRKSETVAIAKSALSDARRLVQLEIQLLRIQFGRTFQLLSIIIVLAASSLVFLGLSLAEVLQTGAGLSPALSYLIIFLFGFVVSLFMISRIRKTLAPQERE